MAARQYPPERWRLVWDVVEEKRGSMPQRALVPNTGTIRQMRDGHPANPATLEKISIKLGLCPGALLHVLETGRLPDPPDATTQEAGAGGTGGDTAMTTAAVAFFETIQFMTDAERDTLNALFANARLRRAQAAAGGGTGHSPTG